MLSKEEIEELRILSKDIFGIEFRKYEIERASKNPTKPWQLIFALYRARIATDR